MLDYQLVRSARRKTIAIEIKSNRLIVRAPFGVSETYIHQLVDNKKPWILAKLQLSQQKSVNNKAQENRLEDGGQLWHQGSKKSLRIVFARKNKVSEDDHGIEVTLNRRYQTADAEIQSQAIKRQLEFWFHQQLEQFIEDRLPQFVQRIALTPTSVKIRRYKARWGSCDSRGAVSFNYLLAMVPDWVIDYVIVHELCHLKHLNHSPDFWTLVKQHFPEYQTAKYWLKQHQVYLSWP